MSKFSLEYEQAQLRAFSAFLLERQQQLANMCDQAKKSGQSTLINPVQFESFPSEVLASYVQAYKRALRPMLPSGLSVSGLCRVGSKHDGGYVMLPPGEGGVVYSLGIDDNVDWDLDMARRDFRVWQYDGSITSLPVNHSSFCFEPLFVHGTKKGASSAIADKVATLPQLLKRNGHWGDKRIILKMDIEGSEWDVFKQLDYEVMQMFSQILVELHVEITDLIRLPYFTAILNKIKRTHLPFHVHANNCDRPVNFCAEKFSYRMEVSYVRREDYAGFTASREFYPTPLDAPCLPELPEVELGYFGLPDRSNG